MVSDPTLTTCVTESTTPSAPFKLGNLLEGSIKQTCSPINPLTSVPAVVVVIGAVACIPLLFWLIPYGSRVKAPGVEIEKTRRSLDTVVDSAKSSTLESQVLAEMWQDMNSQIATLTSGLQVLENEVRGTATPQSPTT